ncbi:hypothetical protein EV193_11641 [Herbihabitans rhizosphaerae]|uniref:Uncharacterized protein n=1 Tax=Herbihabitans rhizosphaerae TaxID=1872711 RepID=A0A4Q7KFR9_9PSEU|nr:hypothetical protein [Herbihabitans rhizosphaerae]RZS30521.1 hypothetical protein EV193_11641 [Herbihabitans rhizosphaerae]
MDGPDLPEADQPFTVEVYLHRWPSGAEKVELIEGALCFQGSFDQRDVEIAERAYPGRIVLLDESGSLEVHPNDGGPPRTSYQKLLDRRGG